MLLGIFVHFYCIKYDSKKILDLCILNVISLFLLYIKKLLFLRNDVVLFNFDFIILNITYNLLIYVYFYICQ